MSDIYVTHTDREMLDTMMGTAMLADDVCVHLLQQKRRNLILQDYQFSSSVYHFVRALPDMPDLQTLAQELEILFPLNGVENGHRQQILQ